MLKPVDNDEPISFTIDTATYERCKAFLRGISLAGRTEAAKALNKMAAAWHREIVNHMPVETGVARASVQIRPADEDGSGPVEAAVGSNIDYIPYLEFGTKYIAGGAVKNWKFGDPPILVWPAKMGDRKRGPRVRSDGSVMRREELMPPFRASWQIIQEKMLDMLRNRLARLMQQGKVTG